MKRVLAITMVAMLAALAGGCGEREQTALYKDGKYRGKPDSRPWDNPPPAYGSAIWQKGDEQAWERSLRTRHAGQDENQRIER